MFSYDYECLTILGSIMRLAPERPRFLLSLNVRPPYIRTGCFLIRFIVRSDGGVNVSTCVLSYIIYIIELDFSMDRQEEAADMTVVSTRHCAQ